MVEDFDKKQVGEISLATQLGGAKKAKPFDRPTNVRFFFSIGWAFAVFSLLLAISIQIAHPIFVKTNTADFLSNWKSAVQNSFHAG